MDYDAAQPSTSGTIVPVIVEEIDTNSLGKYDLTEFFETNTIKLQDAAADDKMYASDSEINSEYKDHNHELTNKFLKGELTFGQFSAQIEGISDSEDEMENNKANIKYVSKTFVKPTGSPLKMNVSQTSQGIRRRRNHLPRALQGLMGEANLRYAKGDVASAEKICFEIIRQVSTAPEPFLCLAQIYENEDMLKSLQLSLLAAHLCPNNAEQWISLAVQFEELGDTKQAIKCYSRALRADPSDVAAHKNLIQLVEASGDSKMILRCYLRYLEHMPLDESENIVDTAKMVATNYHHNDDIDHALKAMEIAYRRCPEHFTPPDINLILELMIALGRYEDGLLVLAQHSNVVVDGITEIFEGENGVEEKFRVISCDAPSELILDLRIKLMICLIHLRAAHLFKDLIDHLLFHENMENCGDLFLEVAEGFMKECYYTEALSLLSPLVESDNYSLAAVWLRYAECLQACGRTDEAISSYQTVIHLAPKHLEPRMILSYLLREKNKYTEALRALEQDEDLDMLDPGLLFERCKLLRDMKEDEQLLQVGQLLLSRHCIRIRNREEAEALTRQQRVVRKNEAVRDVRMARGELHEDTDAPIFLDSNEPSVQDEWLLLKEVLLIAYRKKEYGLCQRIAFSAFGSMRFKDYKQELEFTCLLCCLKNNDGYLGYNIVRDLVQKNWEKPRAWNLYNLIIQRADDVRHNRFLMRFLCRYGASLNPAVHILNGNNCLVAGTYKYALSEYMSRYKQDGAPTHAFLVGVTLFQMACQKFAAKRPSLITQGLAFLKKYAERRGDEAQHEVHYNLGRAFHQIGLVHVAVHHYNKVLELMNPLIESRPEILDLRREAAFNLHLIYAKSGSRDLARMYLMKYVVVA